MVARRSLRVAGTALLLFGFAALCAWAQAGEPKGDVIVKGRSFWQLLQAGGTVGWFIIACSVVSLALIIQNFMEIRRDKLCPPELLGELEALCQDRHFEEARSLCAQEKSFFTNMVGAALAKVSQGYDEMKKSMEDIGNEESFKLAVKISWLNLLGQVGPLLGLFGTVTGMITAFQVIEQKKTPSPADLARGVYEALVTTCQGLVVGIPVLCMYFYFRNKVGGLIIEMGLTGTDFLDRFKKKA